MPSSTSPRPTPTILTGALFSPFAEATFNASPAAVYEALVDTSKWSEWNDFVPSVTITNQPQPQSDSNHASNSRLTKDANMFFKVNMTPTVKTTSKEIVIQLDDIPTGHQQGRITRINWVMDNKAMFIPRLCLQTERVNEIEDMGHDICVYRSWMTFAGPFAHFVKWKYGQALQERFEEWVQGLQKYVEANEKQRREKEAAIELPA